MKSDLPATLADQLGKAMQQAGPSARSVLARVAEAGPTAFDQPAAARLAALLHGFLPLPIRLVVNRSRLEGFLLSNRDLVVAWAGKRGAAD